jgi:hypothetical protein
MPLFAQLTEAATGSGLAFLVIGRHAVIQHGFQRGAEDLVFPDWSGQVAAQARMPRDEWLAYCRSNLSKLRLRPGYAHRRRQNGISAESSL